MRTFTLIGLSLFTSVTLVAILYQISDDLNHTHNAFVRLFPPHPITYTKGLNIKYNSYYIAGAGNNRIYLGNVTAPHWIFIADNSLTDTAHVKVKLDNARLRKTVQVTIVPPYFYMMDGLTPSIYKGSIDSWKGIKLDSSAYFSKSIPISSTSFAIRGVSNVSHENVIGKQSFFNGSVQLKLSDVLKKQIDGLFCTDGELHYNRELSNLVYIYFYRNQFIQLDTNLTIINMGKTIDTISHAKIKIAKVNSQNSITLAAPPLMVNKRSAVSNDLLFVHSAQMAKNESRQLFDNAAVIDVYDLANNNIYKFSFYLHDFNKQKLKDFKVSGNTLIALYDTFIVTYALVPKYFASK